MAEKMIDFEDFSRVATEHAEQTIMVDIRMDDEREFRGQLHLEPGQTLQGLMNSADEFIPVRTLAGEVHLLNKHSIEDIHEMQGCA
jgi:sRNA-binding regulator protein Hfq